MTSGSVAPSGRDSVQRPSSLVPVGASSHAEGEKVTVAWLRAKPSRRTRVSKERRW